MERLWLSLLTSPKVITIVFSIMTVHFHIASPPLDHLFLPLVRRKMSNSVCVRLCDRAALLPIFVHPHVWLSSVSNCGFRRVKKRAYSTCTWDTEAQMVCLITLASSGTILLQRELNEEWHVRDCPFPISPEHISCTSPILGPFQTLLMQSGSGAVATLELSSWTFAHLSLQVAPRYSFLCRRSQILGMSMATCSQLLEPPTCDASFL